MSLVVNTSWPLHVYFCYVTARNEFYESWSYYFLCSEMIKDFLVCKKKRKKSRRKERRKEAGSCDTVKKIKAHIDEISRQQGTE